MKVALVRLGRRLKFPRKSLVLVYGGVVSPVFTKWLEGTQLSIQDLPIGKRDFNIPVGLVAVLKRLRTKEPFFVTYVGVYIRWTRPRVAITLLDNDIRFWALRQRHPQVRFIAVQNGRRGGAGDLDISSFNPTVHGVDSFFCFGGAYGDVISRLTNTRSVIDHGSFRNNSVSPVASVKTGAGWVSQYRPFSKWSYGGVAHEHFFEADRQAFGLFASWCVARGLRIEIIARTEFRFLREELEFYQNAAPPNACLDIKCGSGELDSYLALDAYEMVGTVSSSLGYEALARGTKAFFFDFRASYLGQPEYKFGYPRDYPESGIFWSRSSDVIRCFDALDRLLEMSEDDFKQAANEISEHLMAWDPGNTKLFQEIQSLASEQPPRQKH